MPGPLMHSLPGRHDSPGFTRPSPGVRNLTPPGDPWIADLRQHIAMPDSYRAPGGWRVQVVSLENTPDRHDGTWLRITQYGSWTADVRTPGEVAAFVPLEQLDEDDCGLATVAGTASRAPRGPVRVSHLAAPRCGSLSAWRATARTLLRPLRPGRRRWRSSPCSRRRSSRSVGTRSHPAPAAAAPS